MIFYRWSSTVFLLFSFPLPRLSISLTFLYYKIGIANAHYLPCSGFCVCFVLLSPRFCCAFPKIWNNYGTEYCKLHAIDKMWHVKRLLQSWQNRKRSGTKLHNDNGCSSGSSSNRKMLWMCAPLEPLNRFNFDRNWMNWKNDLAMGKLALRSLDLVNCHFGHFFLFTRRKNIRFNGKNYKTRP